MNKAGDVELVDGAFFPTPKELNTKPTYTSGPSNRKSATMGSPWRRCSRDRLTTTGGLSGTKENNPA